MIAALDDEWKFARQLTTDLLRSCDAETLAARPLAEISPVWKIFRHIGRVHENYLDGFEQGAIAFNPQNGGFSGAGSKAELSDYFQILNDRHAGVLSCLDPDRTINWGDEKISSETLLARLISHECLHHGQFITLWRHLGRPFPESWSAWGEA